MSGNLLLEHDAEQILSLFPLTPDEKGAILREWADGEVYEMDKSWWYGDLKVPHDSFRESLADLMRIATAYVLNRQDIPDERPQRAREYLANHIPPEGGNEE